MGDSKSALVLLAEGAEEMEAVITIDVLRRGGVNVTVAGIAGPQEVKCSRGVFLRPDKSLSESLGENYDVIVLPGGLGGAKALAECSEVGKLLASQEKNGGLVAAICAAPIALNSHRICPKKTITSHPSVKDQLVAGGYNYSEERVVKDGNVITSRGPGTAFEFALALVEALQGADKKNEIIPPMLLKL